MSASLQAKGDPTEDVLGFELLRSAISCLIHVYMIENGN